jgi:Xaa-Pro aminopeptidase
MYRDGIHGFRTENLILVTEDEKTDFGRFLKFETLTLFPIEINLIEMSLMTEDEFHLCLQNRKENGYLKKLRQSK